MLDGLDELTRRKFLRVTGGGALALGAGGLLEACGKNGQAGSSKLPGPAAPGGKPVRGGTLTVGMVGAGNSEQLYPGALGGTVDFFRINQLYDNLFNTSSDADLHVIPGLAESAEPNADASVWTLKLRDGVTWHNGKPFSADDVVYTFRGAWAKPENFAYGLMSKIIKFDGVRKRDRLTVEIPLLLPVAQFETLFTFISGFTWIVPEGSTPKELARRPVGTGPFKFASFTPGRQSVFEANRDYWEEGKPYVDRLVVNTTFGGDTALLNALLAKQVNIMTPFPYSQARRYLNSPDLRLLRSPGPGGVHFYMRVDDGPFADNRVRQAFRLMLNRKALVDNVLSGFGKVGNDIGVATKIVGEYVATDLEPQYDPEKAKSLLKAAGAGGMSAKFATTNINETFVNSATLTAQQAKAVGMNLKVDVISASTYYSEASGFPTRTLGQNIQTGSPSITNSYLNTCWAGAPFNLTRWGKGLSKGGDAADKLLFEAIGTLDKGRAAELWHEVQKIQYDEGGFVSWGFGDVLDAVSPNVRGLSNSPLYSLNGNRVLDTWLAEA